MRIYRYPISPLGYINNGAELPTVFLPARAKLLHVGPDPSQKNICAWAIVDPTPGIPEEEWKFILYGTGYDFLQDPHLLMHCGSFVVRESMVYHVFLKMVD